MGKTLYAVGNRTHEKAVTFAEKYQVAKVYDDFHEMFTDPDVDVIYITTPHNTHIGFVREALKNKKHVLCGSRFISGPAPGGKCYSGAGK